MSMILSILDSPILPSLALGFIGLSNKCSPINISSRLMINTKYFFKGLSCVKSFDSPAIALAICMVAIGALFKNIGLNLQESIFSTFLTYALPGSLVMAETMILGGSLLNIFFCSLACKFTSVSNDSFSDALDDA